MHPSRRRFVVWSRCITAFGALGVFAPAANAQHIAGALSSRSLPALEVPHVRVLPWDGHRAALTFTFDDGSPSEATLAVPALDEKGVKGTFFITTKNMFGNDALWAHAEQEGHELGNHTVDHCHADDLGHHGCMSAWKEVERSTQFIESKLGAPDVYTFAYPFVDQSANYKRVASTDFLLARAGKGGLVDSASTPDWYSMDARFIEPTRGETLADWDGWIDEADTQKKWLVLVFHSILPEVWCEGIPKETLEAIVDHAKSSEDLWIDTFVNVGAYLRAERMFEELKPVPRGHGVVWRWSLPRHFPHGRTLRMTVDAGTLSQGRTHLVPDSAGNYAVPLDARELSWSP